MFKRLFKTLIASGAYVLVLLTILVVFRQICEARYIPSTAMQPTIKVNDRILIEKVSKWRGQAIERGSIVCFYPPAIEMPDGKDMTYDIPHIMGRLTGLPLFPNTPAFIKRVIGINGDRIRIEAGKVFVNDKPLDEPYLGSAPDYKLSTLNQIRGRSISNTPIAPYGDNPAPIVVPKGQLFVLGDDRSNSEDSHVWGFLPEDRIIGRLWCRVYPSVEYMWHYQEK